MSELFDEVRVAEEEQLVQRCAALDVVSWFLVFLQQTWSDVGVRYPHAEIYTDSASKLGFAAMTGEQEKGTRYGNALNA